MQQRSVAEAQEATTRLTLLALTAVVRGRDWLVANQAADGSWPIQAQLISKLTRKDFTRVNGIYTFWGTAWATIALLQEVPVRGGLARSVE